MENTILEAVRKACAHRKAAALLLTSDKEKCATAWEKTESAFSTSLYCQNGGEYAAEGIKIYCDIFGISVEEFAARIAITDKKSAHYCAQKALLKFAFILQALAGATDTELTAYSAQYGKESLCDAHTHNIARIILKQAEKAAEHNGAFSAADLKEGLGYREFMRGTTDTAAVAEALKELPDYGVSTINTQMGQINSIMQAFTECKVYNKKGEECTGRRAIQKTDSVIIDPRFVAMLAQINGSGYEWKRIDSRRM